MIKALKEFIHEGVLDQLSNARRLAICNVDIPMMERGLDALMLVHLKFRDTHALLFNPHGHSHQLAIFAWYLFLNAKGDDANAFLAVMALADFKEKIKSRSSIAMRATA